MFTLLGNEDKMKYVEFRANSIARKLNPNAGGGGTSDAADER
nr:hypothetical protein [Pedobacter sp. ASV19]